MPKTIPYKAELWAIKSKSWELARDGGLLPLFYTTEEEAKEEVYPEDGEEVVGVEVLIKEISR